MKMEIKEDIKLCVPVEGRHAEILTPVVAQFLARLHRNFNTTRKTLLEQRAERQAKLAVGLLDFLPETREIREGDWKVAPGPRDLVN